jgi:hypothetical protein
VLVVAVMYVICRDGKYVNGPKHTRFSRVASLSAICLSASRITPNRRSDDIGASWTQCRCTHVVIEDKRVALQHCVMTCRRFCAYCMCLCVYVYARVCVHTMCVHVYRPTCAPTCAPSSLSSRSSICACACAKGKR